MSEGPPRPLERAAEEPATPAPRPDRSRVVGIVVLLLATIGAVLVASLSSSSTAPRGGTSTAPAGGSSDLAPPVVATREHGRSPFDAPTTDSAVTACVAAVRAEVATDDSVEVLERFGDIDETQGRADSLIVEGTIGQRVWHCASARRQDGAVASRSTVIERAWPGVSTSFPAVHAVTMAAEESCMRRVRKIYPDFAFRGVRHEQRGSDTLYVSGDALPLDNDLNGDFSCLAIVRGGRIVDARAKKSR